MTASRTAPAKLQTTAISKRADRQILPRRHSFNNQSGDSTASTTSVSNKWYEADLEESEDTKDNKDGSWSDSESGFLHPPIKSRLKGLLGTWGRKSRPHRPLAPSISDPVPILQPPIATVSEYARRIELLANDLSNGTAIEAVEAKRKSGSPASSGYYTPQMASAGSKKTSPNSSLRNSSEENSDDDLMSDSEGQQSASASLSSASTNNNDADRNKTIAFYTANELMTSERVYVDVLKLLNVEFREFLQKARKEAKNGLMPDADYSRLFNNLPELQTLNEVSNILDVCYQL